MLESTQRSNWCWEIPGDPVLGPCLKVIIWFFRNILNTYNNVKTFLKKVAFEFSFWGKEPRDPTGAGKYPEIQLVMGKYPEIQY